MNTKYKFKNTISISFLILNVQMNIVIIHLMVWYIDEKIIINFQMPIKVEPKTQLRNQSRPVLWVGPKILQPV